MYQVRLTRDLAPPLRGAAKQVRFATAVALTKVAKIAQEDLRGEMMRVFDAPTPYTLNSLRTSPATPSKLVATVHLKDDVSKGGTPAHKYLDPEIEGGSRRHKRFEVALERSAGKPGSLYAVPGIGAKKDRFGNLPAGEIRRILSYVRAAEQTLGFQANTSEKLRKRLAKGSKTKRPTGFFVATPSEKRTKHLKPGVYQWTQFAFGRAIKPVIVFNRTPAYKKRLPFAETVDKTIDREYGRQFAAALERAIATAR